MSFDSLAYWVFLPIVILGYYLLPSRWQRGWLVGASLWFYGQSKWWYVWVLVGVIVVNWLWGKLIDKPRGRLSSKQWLMTGVVANVLVLAVFKYSYFGQVSLKKLIGGQMGWMAMTTKEWLLPVGISFYVITAISYLVDVYKKKMPTETNLINLGLYLGFFPKLLAGPIERAKGMMCQFKSVHKFDEEQILSGLTLILWGLFKKTVANRLGTYYVNSIYVDSGSFSGLPVLMAMYAYSLQIFLDFSGYTDIALGSARTLGIKLSINFDRPYLATSIRDFWKRWHISLTDWLRDYIYIPLGGSRVSKLMWMRNIMAVFLISGLWHGANWTYVIWGAIHGGWYLLERITQNVDKEINRWVGLDKEVELRKGLAVIVTFHLVSVAWVFFRADSINQAINILMSLFAKDAGKTTMSLGKLGLSALLVWVVLVGEEIRVKMELRDWLLRWWRVTRWAVYGAFALAILNMGVGKETPFIYFQF